MELKKIDSLRQTLLYRVVMGTLIEVDLATDKMKVVFMGRTAEGPPTTT